MATFGKALVIGVEGNYFGQVVRRQRYRSGIAAETRYTAATSIPPHRHQFGGFFLALRGSFETRTAAGTHVSSSGEVSFHPPEELHSIRLLSQRGRGFNVEVTAIRRESMPGQLTQSKVAASRLPSLIQQMHQELHCKDIASELAVEGLLLQVEAELMRLENGRESREPVWLTGIEEFLRAHTDKCLCMDDLAAIYGVEPRHIANMFRRFKGCTPAEYHRRLRLAIAQRRLTVTTMPIAQIATECGFFDQSHFTNTFRKVFGCTPFQYRRLH